MVAEPGEGTPGRKDFIEPAELGVDPTMRRKGGPGARQQQQWQSLHGDDSESRLEGATQLAPGWISDVGERRAHPDSDCRPNPAERLASAPGHREEGDLRDAPAVHD